MRAPSSEPACQPPQARIVGPRTQHQVSWLLRIGGVHLNLPDQRHRSATPAPPPVQLDLRTGRITRTIAQGIGHGPAEVESDPGFADTTVDWRQTTAFIDTHDLYDAGDPESAEAIDRLRTALIPSALAGSDATAAVGGTRAYAMDELELLTSRAPYAVATILSVTFLLLLVMFRSIVIPLKAIALNLLGTLATFGALVATYQWGWGAALFGFPHLDGISPYMPVMIFALVFGLSMDYHVFLLARIKERYDATGDTKAAVIEGVTRTGPLITGAALIMVAVFSGFAVAAIPELSQWGFGLAVGVLLDTAVIRVLLVPAAMVWLGKANWYLPRWLESLPTLAHEPASASIPDESREPAPV